MEDKTFAQAIGELHQRAQKEITLEVLHCWPVVQQGTSVSDATAYLENQNMRDAVTHALFYMSLQAILYDAKRHDLLNSQRYRELKSYLNRLAVLTQQQ